MSSTSPHVHVCQMPRSLCRISGRAPYKLAWRIRSLGNVSAAAALFIATCPILPNGRTLGRDAALRTPRRLVADLCHDMKTPAQAGQALRALEFGRSGG